LIKLISLIISLTHCYETICRPYAEKLKAASKFSGLEKHYLDEEKQRKRDELIIKGTRTQVIISKKGEKNIHLTAWVRIILEVIQIRSLIESLEKVVNNSKK
jgi:hypothetical protein